MKTIVVVTGCRKKSLEFAELVNYKNLGNAFVNGTEGCSISGTNDEQKLEITETAKNKGYQIFEL